MDRLKTGKTKILSAFRDSLDDLFHPPQSNIAALDVLRSAAILLVFTGHYVGAFHASPVVQNFPLFRWGWTGVDLFFVLSGLLIGSQLYKELNRTGRIRIGHFLLRRGLRIWPLYYGFVIFAALGYVAGKSIAGIWSDIFFLSNFFRCHVEGGWSLSTEEQFYIITPILLSLFAIKLSPRRMWVVPCLAIAALITTRAWVVAHSALPEHLLRQKLYFPIYTHADGLAVGVFLAWLVTFHKDRLRSKLFAALVAAAMFICGLALYGIKPLLLNFTALGLIYGSLELYGISALPLPSVVRWRGFYLVSRLSFGLYLNHMGMFSLLSPLLSGWSNHGILGSWTVYLLCLGACLLVAAMTFILIERPFLVIRARWVDREKLAAAPGKQEESPNAPGGVAHSQHQLSETDQKVPG
jgi:peptidoglycan/LPS O-acetylase OafA/YrhL